LCWNSSSTVFSLTWARGVSHPAGRSPAALTGAYRRRTAEMNALAADEPPR